MQNIIDLNAYGSIYIYNDKAPSALSQIEKKKNERGRTSLSLLSSLVLIQKS